MAIFYFGFDPGCKYTYLLSAIGGVLAPLFLSYMIGSITFALVVGKLLYKTDIEVIVVGTLVQPILLGFLEKSGTNCCNSRFIKRYICFPKY